MWIDRLGQDLRYAFRAMRSSPGFTAAAVLVLAIGIGATVAAFSAFNIVALRPLPVRDPQSILRFGRHAPDRSASDVPYPAVAFYREHTRTLSAVLAQTESDLSLEGAERPASTFFVTANFFDELGARPAQGRLFSVGDERPDAPAAVVLGQGFWASHFGSDPAVVGTSVRLNGKAATIIGVVAREFSGSQRRLSGLLGADRASRILRSREPGAHRLLERGRDVGPPQPGRVAADGRG